MTEEIQGATVAAPVSTATVQTNETPAVVTPAATEDAGQTAESAEKPELTPEQKNERWLRTKATKAERNNARLHAENEQMREQLAKLAPPASGTQPTGQQAVDPVALADHIATAREIAKTSNDVVADGKKRFAATWDSALSTLISEAGPLIDPRTMMPTPLGEAILASDDKAALLHHIGSDPSLADELSELTPTQLGRRMARIEADMKVKPTKPVSSAPAPINPLSGGAAATVVDLENLPMDKYREARAKQGARWAR